MRNIDRIRYIFLILTAVVTLGLPFVGDLSGTLQEPHITPEQFLDGRPFLETGNMVIIEPSSSFWVFGLAAVILVVAVLYIWKSYGENSRFLWGLGMLFWAVSAASAGLSYQSFGYELKARGHEFVLYTSWPEIIYMLLAFYSIALLLAATGYFALETRKGIIKNSLFACIYSFAYAVIMAVGVLTENTFLMSYNAFLLFSGVNFVLMFIYSVRHYRRYRDNLNKRMIIIWLSIAVVNALYFVYLLSGAGDILWSKGIWFTANDVLHVLLIIWIVQGAVMLWRTMKDGRVRGI